MTLILGMSKPEGIYLCVDYRVTDSRTGGVLDDAAPKILQVTFPRPGRIASSGQRSRHSTPSSASLATSSVDHVGPVCCGGSWPRVVFTAQAVEHIDSTLVSEQLRSSDPREWRFF